MKIWHIHIHIRRFSGARIYLWILSMKKSCIHIHIRKIHGYHGYIRGYYTYSRYVEIIYAKEFLPLLDYCWHCPYVVIEEA